jgi:hypothetical protein
VVNTLESLQDFDDVFIGPFVYVAVSESDQWDDDKWHEDPVGCFLVSGPIARHIKISFCLW